MFWCVVHSSFIVFNEFFNEWSILVKNFLSHVWNIMQDGLIFNLWSQRTYTINLDLVCVREYYSWTSTNGHLSTCNRTVHFTLTDTSLQRPGFSSWPCADPYNLLLPVLKPPYNGYHPTTAKIFHPDRAPIHILYLLYWNLTTTASLFCPRVTVLERFNVSHVN